MSYQKSQTSFAFDSSSAASGSLALDVTNNQQSGASESLRPKERALLIMDHWEIGQKLAWSIIKGWQVEMQRDEVISLVGAALCEAAHRYDPNKGTSFSTFLYYHLRGMLIKEISKASDQKKIQENLRQHSDESHPSPPVSLSSVIEGISPEQVAENKQLARLCWKACSRLKPLEREIIVKHYIHEHTIAEIARELGYCRSYISRIKSRARDSIAAHVQREL